MSMQERLAVWRDPAWWGGSPDIEEAALRQFAFVVAGVFIEEHFEALAEWMSDPSGNDEVPGLADWIDEYADRPVTESDGWGRRS